MERYNEHVKEWANELQQLAVGEIRFDEPLRKHTTFRIGGPADLLILPNNVEQAQRVVAFTHERGIPLVVIGGGSNLLVADSGWRGIALKLGNQLKTLRFDGADVYAEAGVLLPVFALKAAEHQLRGVEFAAGIPGSLGGATVMNAGAHGRQLSDIIQSIICCDSSGVLQTIEQGAAEFVYRGSRFKTQQDLVILAIRFRLAEDDGRQIKARMADYTAVRKAKQPLAYPSAGSVFKNPLGHTAGQLIEAVGAKGWRVGDAQVSEIHSNFIVNQGQATCADVLALIAQIQKSVLAQSGIVLEREIVLLGQDDLRENRK